MTQRQLPQQRGLATFNHHGWKVFVDNGPHCRGSCRARAAAVMIVASRRYPIQYGVETGSYCTRQSFRLWREVQSGQR